MIDGAQRQARVLIVEDDDDIAQVLQRSLRLEGYETRIAVDGEAALGAANDFVPDLVVLDLGLPKIDGMDVARRLRAADDVPILMLTARDAVESRVEGLDAGADDYLVKPFALRELHARLRALLRRAGPGLDGGALRFADLALDPSTREVHRGARPIELTRTEFLLLELFLAHPRQVLGRAQIFDHLWGYDPGPTSNALAVYVGYLRRKTEEGGEPRLLHTVRGVGYVLREG